MANTSSAIKRIRQIARRAEINRRNKTRVRKQVKRLKRAIESKDTETAQKLLRPTISAVDRAVQKGILKKNNASRVKSRLTLRVHELQRPASAPAESSP